jgi:actin-like ATPase involved in cell morphogenesis
MTLVGEAAESAMAERGRILRPVRRGRVVYEDAYQTLVMEALHRMGLSPEETKAVVGTLCRPSEEELDKLEKLLKERVKLADVRVYPASLGTLLSMGLDSGVIIDIGEGTTSFLAVEEREIVDFAMTTVATDSLLSAVHDRVLTDLEVDLRKEEIRMLAIGARKSLRKYASLIGVKTITLEEIREIIKKETGIFAEEIIEWARTFLARASPIASENHILTGGGSLIYRDTIAALMPEVSFKMPTDPICSNAEGLFKLAKEVFPAPPEATKPTPQ